MSLQRHLVLPPLVAVEVLLPVGVAGASSLRIGRVINKAGSLKQTVSDRYTEATLLTSLSPLPGWNSGTLRAARASLGPADCRSMLALSMASTWGREMVVKTGPSAVLLNYTQLHSSTLHCSRIQTIGILVCWYDYSHATNLFLVDASVVDVTWE